MMVALPITAGCSTLNLRIVFWTGRDTHTMERPVTPPVICISRGEDAIPHKIGLLARCITPTGNDIQFFTRDQLGMYIYSRSGYPNPVPSMDPRKF